MVTISHKAGYAIDRMCTISHKAGYAIDRMCTIGHTLTAGLYRWFSPSISGKKICLIGDSTIVAATNLFAELDFYCFEGEALYGVSTDDILNYGENGASLEAFLDGNVTHDIVDTIAADADLYVICYGTNDVRLGACNKDTLISRLGDCIGQLRAGVPLADIVLLMPNSMLLDDPTSSGYVDPLASAQDYTDILREAYQFYKDKFANILLIDTQTDIFGTTCLAGASNPLMTDILHPNDAGNAERAAHLVAIIGQPTLFSDTLAAAARTANYRQDYTDYYQAVEDTDYYDLIATGRWVAQADTWLLFSWPGADAGDIFKTDICKMGAELPWALPMAASPTNSAGNTFIISMPAGYPPVTITGGTVNIYRHKYIGNATAETYIKDATNYPYQHRGVVQTENTGWIALSAYPDETAANTWTAIDGDTDKVVLEDGTEITGFTKAPVGNLMLIYTGETDKVGMRAVVVGNHAGE